MSLFRYPTFVVLAPDNTINVSDNHGSLAIDDLGASRRAGEDPARINKILGQIAYSQARMLATLEIEQLEAQRKYDESNTCMPAMNTYM